MKTHYLLPSALLLCSLIGLAQYVHAGECPQDVIECVRVHPGPFPEPYITPLDGGGAGASTGSTSSTEDSGVGTGSTGSTNTNTETETTEETGPDEPTEEEVCMAQVQTDFEQCAILAKGLKDHYTADCLTGDEIYNDCSIEGDRIEEQQLQVCREVQATETAQCSQP